MPSKTSIKGFFKNLHSEIEDRAEENLKDMLPTLSFLMHEYAEEEMKKLNKSSMTGNFINSFGIALYKDGKFLAVGTTHDEEGRDPIQVTLATGDTFRKRRRRYSGSKQMHKFVATEGTKHIFANVEVLNWLRRYPPTRKEGFAFRAVSIVDYNESVGGDKVLLRLADDIEQSGGIITQFNLG